MGVVVRARQGCFVAVYVLPNWQCSQQPTGRPPTAKSDAGTGCPTLSACPFWIKATVVLKVGCCLIIFHKAFKRFEITMCKSLNTAN